MPKRKTSVTNESDAEEGSGRRIDWSTEMCDLLLALYEQQQRNGGSERGLKGTSWSEILTQMKEQYPWAPLTTEKLRNKFISLKKDYIAYIKWLWKPVASAKGQMTLFGMASP
jgi:hypothetical protein